MRHLRIVLMVGTLTGGCLLPSRIVSAAEPTIEADMAWQWEDGRSGQMPSPNVLTAKLTLRNAGDDAWQIVPAVFQFERHRLEAFGRAVLEEARIGPFEDHVSFDQHAGPGPDSGTIVITMWGPGFGFVQIAQRKCEAQRQGQLVEWRRWDLTKAEPITIEWEHTSLTTFTAETKADQAYEVWHYGPLAYREDQPEAPCYLLVSQAALPLTGEPKPARATRWQVLDAEYLSGMIEDEEAPIMLREAALSWLWNQPRPVPGAAETLTRIALSDTGYSWGLRRGAAAGLLSIRHEPAYPALLELANNAAAHFQVRLAVIRRLAEAVPDQALDVLEALARDNEAVDAVRIAAVESLPALGQRGWTVVRALRDDDTVGAKCKELLEERRAAKKAAAE